MTDPKKSNPQIEAEENKINSLVSASNSSPANHPSTSVNLNDDLVFPVQSTLLEPGSVAPDFNFILTTGVNIYLSQLCERSPVLINFIKGTWCPFCTAHLANLRKWQQSISRRNVTMLALSNEDVQVLRTWSQENRIDYLFGQVVDKAIFKKYGIDIENQEFPAPATFLVEKNMKVRLSYMGKRNDQLKDKIHSETESV